MTDTNDKLRAIFLATLMVLSVFAMTIAFGGTVTARAANDHTEIQPGDIIFQGETELDFQSNFGQSTLTGASGAAENLILQEGDIAVDQTVGRYTVDGQAASNGVDLVTGRVTSLDVDIYRNGVDTGGDADGGSVGTNSASDLRVRSRFNYEEAEPLAVTVEDSSGLDITNQVLNDSVPSGSDNLIETSGGNVSIDLSREDAGEYTIIVEGDDDLDFGQATRSTTITLTTARDLSINLGRTTVTQGDNVQFTVSGGTDGDTHVVLIDRSDFRTDISVANAHRIFRNVGDTVEVGLTNDSIKSPRNNQNVTDVDQADFAYAIVEIDGTTGVGSIETRLLRDTSVDVEVYQTNNPVVAAGANEEDDASLTVNEGETTLDSPVGSYVVGSEVDITGSATSSDEVAIYVRDSGDWEILDLDSQTSNGIRRTISVDADDTFEEEDVQLNRGDGGGNQILTLVDSYRIGVIDADDAAIDSANPDGTLTTREFSRGISTSYTIRVTDSSLDGQFSTINGQVAPIQSGETDLSGTAPGSNTVFYIFIDKAGNLNYDSVNVEADGTFEEEDIVVSDPTTLRSGQITAAILSTGRDGDVGDGPVGTSFGTGLPGLRNFLDDIQNNRTTLNGQQVVSLIRSETVDDTASDDLIVTQTFRLAESSTSIDAVYPTGMQMTGINQIEQGETMVVSGRTNLRPTDNTISLELLQEDTPLALVSTDQWESNGRWSVEIDTSGIETGTYQLEADDGENTDVVTVEIVTEREEMTPGPEPGASPTPRVVTEVRTRTVQGPSPEPRTVVVTQTPSGQPGFGVAIALVALLAAAMLALRRRN